MRNILKLLTLSAAAVSVAGCAYGGMGSGYGSPYGYDSYGYGSPYGYGAYGGSGVSVSVGYNSGSPYGYGGYGGYGSPYGYGYGSPYGGSYGSPYYGWYNNCYYPGSGNYVYDSYRQPRLLTTAERVYWTDRKRAYNSAAVQQGQRAPRAETNWSGFQRDRIQTRAASSLGQTRPAVVQTRPAVAQKRDVQRQVRTERVRDRRDRDSD